MSGWVLGGIVVGGIVLVLVLLAYVVAMENSYKQHCAEAGGHIYDPGTMFCVSSDGRFVEVYP